MSKECRTVMNASACLLLFGLALGVSISAGLDVNVAETGSTSSMIGAAPTPVVSLSCPPQLNNCGAKHCNLVGDGWCDAFAPYNTADCNWDGGDCCSGSGIRRCLDPTHANFNTTSAFGFNTTLPYPQNPRYQAASNGQIRNLSSQSFTDTYNNFYEFGFMKNIASEAQEEQALFDGPWTFSVTGLVENPITLDVKDLIKMFPLEERIYRHRCVEAWSVVVPWLGFPLSALLDVVKPLPSATYLKFTSFTYAPAGNIYPYPYTEGLTIDEAWNELAFISVGSYQQKLKPQAGAPIRLTIPWKYGFKSAKSLVNIELTTTRPTTFWEAIAPSEYGFWCNVNPQVSHPRWSQARESPLGGSAPTGAVNTQLFNGYTELVQYLYVGVAPTEKLFK